MPHPAPADSARLVGAGGSAPERARALIFALASADQTYDDLGPHLKRALGLERRPLDRSPRRVRQELEIAARKLAVLTRQVETALACLPVQA
jgi:hypothetical protein